MASASLGVFIAGGCAMAQPAPVAQPSQQQQQTPPATAPRDNSKAQSISGTVDGYNLDPRGIVNGIVVKQDDGRMAQFNLPPEAAGTIAAAAGVGQKVTVAGEPQTLVGDRGVFRLSSLSTADGKQFNLPSPRDGGPGGGGRLPWQVAHVDGVVKQLNYSPRGEVDGAQLDTGDFVHVGPRDAASLNLAVGQKVSADGRGHPMLAGHTALDATKVNGTTIEQPPPPRPQRDGMRGGPGGGGGDGPMRDGPMRGGPPRDRGMRGDGGGPDGAGPGGPDGGPGGGGPDGQFGPRGPRGPGGPRAMQGGPGGADGAGDNLFGRADDFPGN
jgi:hypothetical protein